MKLDWVWYWSWKLVWMRWWPEGPGWAIHLPSDKPLFSERYGYNKPAWKIRCWKYGIRLFRLETMA